MQVQGTSALAQRLFKTWDLDLVYEAPSPSCLAECSPLDESLYCSETAIDPLMLKVLLATSQFCSSLVPLLQASLTLV